MNKETNAMRTLVSAGLIAAAGFCSSLTSAGPAFAAATDWQTVEGGRVRLLATPPSPDGTIRAALDIDLKPGWDTYWRAPGAAGIPPLIGLEDSDNVENSSLHFPPPEKIGEGATKAIGYAQPVALPLTVHQAEPGRKSILKANVFLGICKNICIPFSASYTLDVVPESAPPDEAAERIRAGYAALPEKPGDDFDVEKVSLSPDENRLVIRTRLPADAGDATVYAAGPPGWSFEDARMEETDGAGKTFSLPVADGPEKGSLSGETVNIVVKAAGRSIETRKTVE